MSVYGLAIIPYSFVDVITFACPRINDDAPNSGLHEGDPAGDDSIFLMVIGPKVHWSENHALVRMVNSPTGQ